MVVALEWCAEAEGKMRRSLKLQTKCRWLLKAQTDIRCICRCQTDDQSRCNRLGHYIPVRVVLGRP